MNYNEDELLQLDYIDKLRRIVSFKERNLEESLLARLPLSVAR